jgi:hypothetical protein
MLAAALTLLSGRFQLAVAFDVDPLLPTSQHILQCDVAGGAVQTDVIVVIYVACDQTPCISSDNGVPGRMHSLFSDLCQRSIFPFDCG